MEDENWLHNTSNDTSLINSTRLCKSRYSYNCGNTEHQESGSGVYLAFWQMIVILVIFFSIFLIYHYIRNKIRKIMLLRKDDEKLMERKTFVKKFLLVYQWKDIQDKDSIMRIVDATSEEDDRQLCCAICFEKYEPKDKVSRAVAFDDNDGTKMKCNHVFHTECIQEWLLKSSGCPICRTTFLGSKESPSFLTNNIDNDVENNNGNNQTDSDEDVEITTTTSTTSEES